MVANMSCQICVIYVASREAGCFLFSMEMIPTIV